jgi:2'-5' RNA ligase
MVRVFAASPLPENITKIFLELSGRNPGIEGVRWTKKDNLHVTLFFIGETGKENLEKIISKLESTLFTIKRFRIEFDCIEIRKTKGKPSMIWARFRKSEEFSQLSAAIFQKVKEFMTINPSHKDPIPHTTLARIKSGADVYSADLEISYVASLEISGIELWMTVNTKDGVIYERLWKGKFPDN